MEGLVHPTSIHELSLGLAVGDSDEQKYGTILRLDEYKTATVTGASKERFTEPGGVGPGQLSRNWRDPGERVRISFKGRELHGCQP